MFSRFLDVLVDPLDGSELRIAPENTSPSAADHSTHADYLESRSGRRWAIETAPSESDSPLPPGTSTAAAPSRYLNFLRPSDGPARQTAQEVTASGDDAAMVHTRERFLSAGFFAPFVEAVSAAVADALDESTPEGRGHATDTSGEAEVPSEHPVIVEVGAGTGYYLAHTLDSLEDVRGLGLDISTAAAALLAHAHPRSAALLADIHAPLPLRTSSIDIISAVFSPVNAEEFARVLRPGGQVVTLNPAPGHLDELRAKVGLDPVGEEQISKIAQEFSSAFDPVAEPVDLSFPLDLDHEALRTSVIMSPSLNAQGPQVVAKTLELLPQRLTVMAHARLARYRLR